MNHQGIPSGVAVVVAGAGFVDYIGLQVLTASDLTFLDSLGTTSTLTAVPAGSTIICKVVKVTTCSGVVLGSRA